MVAAVEAKMAQQQAEQVALEERTAVVLVARAVEQTLVVQTQTLVNQVVMLMAMAVGAVGMVQKVILIVVPIMVLLALLLETVDKLLFMSTWRRSKL